MSKKKAQRKPPSPEWVLKRDNALAALKIVLRDIKTHGGEAIGTWRLKYNKADPWSWPMLQGPAEIEVDVDFPQRAYGSEARARVDKIVFKLRGWGHGPGTTRRYTWKGVTWSVDKAVAYICERIGVATAKAEAKKRHDAEKARSGARAQELVVKLREVGFDAKIVEHEPTSIDIFGGSHRIQIDADRDCCTIHLRSVYLQANSGRLTLLLSALGALLDEGNRYEDPHEAQ